MAPPDDFASLMQASSRKSADLGIRKLRRGEIVEGTIVQIAHDSVYVDVGTPTEARVEKSSLLDENGQLRVAVGDKLKGTVVDARSDSPQLAVSFGRNAPVDREALNVAFETKTPIVGKVTGVNKGGLEVDISGTRAFCPMSQMELTRVDDFSVYEGQQFEFLITEIREQGRNVVVSRRALLEQRREETTADARKNVVPGAELEGTVTNITKHGAVVDLAGVSGFVHISELAGHRVDRVEDIVQKGTKVTVRVLGIEPGEKGERIRLSMKQLSGAEPAPKPAADEVLEGTIVRAVGGGLVVRTTKGEGFVPVRELELAPGADHRRAYPIGKILRVVMVSHDAETGRIQFSVKGVADVEERANFRTFGGAGKGEGNANSFGSLGDLLKGKVEPVKKKPAGKGR